ncbi:hypothetical protein GCM10009821_21300 [Aeromicrobium halocynthiae]|uniref:Major facilitator superfamily (MFS) profile domain-containing protein n=1 Tax=Aeromicrobium halocynthiae TaxID=560557 RepID=A0ABN2W3G2_9ACTN
MTNQPDRPSDHTPGDHAAAGHPPADPAPADRARRDPAHDDRAVADRDAARERFGGQNIGAAFFGWIVAMGVAILLAGIIGAVLTAVGSDIGVTQSEAEREAGTIAVATAVVALLVLGLAYLAGGYVAGRMSRFDGARQGLGVWGIGLLVTIVSVGLGAIFGATYDVLARVDLPRLPLSGEQLTGGSIVAALVVLAVTLLGALAGGVLGQRYHRRVDRAVRR